MEVIPGIEDNIRKAGETNRKVQNLASYINVETLGCLRNSGDN